MFAYFILSLLFVAHLFVSHAVLHEVSSSFAAGAVVLQNAAVLAVVARAWHTGGTNQPVTHDMPEQENAPAAV